MIDDDPRVEVVIDREGHTVTPLESEEIHQMVDDLVVEVQDLKEILVKVIQDLLTEKGDDRQTKNLLTILLKKRKTMTEILIITEKENPVHGHRLLVLITDKIR